MIPQVALGEITSEISRPVALEPSALYRSVGVKWYGAGVHVHETREGHLFDAARFQIEQDDLIYNDMWARMGSVAIVPAGLAGSVASSHFPTFRLDASKVIPSYLSWYFRTPSFWNDCENASRGSTGRNQIKRRTFSAIQVPLPPLDEQHRTVARIEEVAAKVEEARGLRSFGSTELAATLMAFRRAILGDAAASDWVPLSKHVAEIENGKSPATEGRAAAEHEWAVLKVGAVSFGSFKESENKALPPSFKPIERYEVKIGDFLMSRANTSELVGACAIVRSTRPRLMLSDKIFRFKFKPTSDLVPEFLDHALKSPALRAQIVTGATGTSPTMKNISKEKVLSLLIPNISTSEQRRIVADLGALQSKVDSVKTLQSETAAELDAMLPAILDKAFKGEL